ncbi:LPS export ABC transporter periplasmic protein LptC [Bauldia litoralis]|uniref:LPS export ABC transporter periplasmic protein LptC n=1 Tax=Bauldia litoralis TaxID=665467 RepID=UPI0032646B40
MTDYYYQSKDEDLPEEGEERRPRRLSPADQYPADRAFFTTDSDPLPPDAEDAVPDDDGEEAAGYRDGMAYDLVPVEIDDAAYAPDEDEQAAWDNGSEDTETEPYAADYDRDPDDDSEAYAPPLLPAPTAGGRVSVAESGMAAARRIRFDPTQERGAGHYTSARRHSRLVSVLKFALPGIALVGIVAFLGFVQFAPAPDDAVITLSGINVESESVTMQTPHISGFDGTKRAYEVRAARAIQDLGNPKIVTMEEIVARLRMDDGETAHLTATTGTYDDETKQMVLSKGIALRTTNGYEANLEDAQVDIAKSHMTTGKPLTITTSQAKIEANAMEFRENGKYVMFRNGVTVFFTPPDPKEDEPAGTPTTAPDAANAGAPTATAGGSS